MNRGNREVQQSEGILQMIKTAQHFQLEFHSFAQQSVQLECARYPESLLINSNQSVFSTHESLRAKILFSFSSFFSLLVAIANRHFRESEIWLNVIKRYQTRTRSNEFTPICEALPRSHRKTLVATFSSLREMLLLRDAISSSWGSFFSIGAAVRIQF